MAKHATDAEVMEYLWPTQNRVQRGHLFINPKITSVGLAAALVLFSTLLFGERAEAWGGSENDGVHAAMYLVEGQTAQFDRGLFVRCGLLWNPCSGPMGRLKRESN